MLGDSEIDRRLREYVIRQLLNWLRFLLAVNDISDSGTKTFDDVCADERAEFIHDQTHDMSGQFYDRPNLYVPNYACLWDLIFNTLGHYNQTPFTPILSAYCRSNRITTKQALYSHMSDELESWVDTIDQFEDIVTIAIGMSKNRGIYETFMTYLRRRDEDGVYKSKTFYTDALDVLKKNNFENIDPCEYYIVPNDPIQKTFDDPLQQIFYEQVIWYVRQYLVECWSRDPKFICHAISSFINSYFAISIQIQPTFAEIVQKIDTIDQFIEYCESKIPQYPAEITDRLLILRSISGRIPGYENEQTRLANLAKMAKLSEYNLRDLPIREIVYGLRGATPIHEIPLDQIPEYYARLTQKY